MSAPPVEAVESDPAATTLSNDETVTKPSENGSAPTDKAAEGVEAEVEESKATNGNTEVTEKDGETKKEDTTQPPRRHYAKPVNHSKYDPAVLEASDDAKAIRAQVEFYFGDANLPVDEYLWGLTDGSSNVEVPLDLILKFGRMRRFQPRSAVVSALKDSQFLVVSGDDGFETVKRKVAYDPNSSRHKILGRSVYVKGFGEEEPSSQFDIEAFFAPYGPTNAVRLRRSEDRAFKGSVFVEFADDGLAQKFLDLDPKPKWKGTTELEIKSKKAYMDGKEEDIRAGRMQPSESWSQKGRGRGRGRNDGFRGNPRGGNRGRGRGGQGDRDPDDWKRRREEDRASGFKNDRKGDRKGGRAGQRGGRRGGRDGPGKDDGEKNGTAAEDKGDQSESPATNEKKRAREDDGAGEEAPAKKLDTKTEVTADAS